MTDHFTNDFGSRFDATTTDRVDPQAEKPTKAIIGLVLLIVVGFALYELNGRPANSIASAPMVARNVGPLH